MKSDTGPNPPSRKPSGLARIGAGLFGASVQGGVPRFGTVFRVNPASGDRLVYAFQGGNDGRAPYGDLTEAAGTLYGATEFGGGTGGRFNIGSARSSPPDPPARNPCCTPSPAPMARRRGVGC